MQGWRPKQTCPGRDQGQVHRSSVRKASSERGLGITISRSGCMRVSWVWIQAHISCDGLFPKMYVCTTCTCRGLKMVYWYVPPFQRTCLYALLTALVVCSSNSCHTPSIMRNINPHVVPLHATPCDHQHPKDVCEISPK